MRNVLFGAVPLTILTLVGCTKDDANEPSSVVESSTLRITVQPMFGDQNLFLDSVYTSAEGYDIRFTSLKFFVEDIQGIGGQGESVALFNYANGTLLLERNAEPLSSSFFMANLGVDSIKNHSDPTAFPSSSPLNILNAADMHWSWNPGYIFMKVEAKVDTIQNGIEEFDHNLVYHIGRDENLQMLSFSEVDWQPVSGEVYEFRLKLDMQTFFTNGTQTIDVISESSSHSAAGQEALSLKIIENFKSSITPME